jgi:eukaryotic-like serine/threonine-protein kinase
MAPSPPNTSGAPPASILERGQAIDRFVVLALVGRGGMGEVYAAYDPELDRKVAIKLLRARGDSAEGKSRLLREAQAIAKLQHPNVVVVYDVGTFGDSVFIAMEFVEGRTVGGWLHAEPRGRREILQVYQAAGKGLAAAHAAGLVHRDFKPDNVMVTGDGQVRVMDFGLARQMGEAEEKVEAAALVAGEDRLGETLDPSFDPEATAELGGKSGARLGVSSGKYLSVKLTQTGAMMGTPAYMAPEQFAVAATDARTDQFSFCIALYEALYGQRPFAGETFTSLMASVTTGAVRPPPPSAKVPGWMRRVLLRGLAVAPEARYPSMGALLTALETDPKARFRPLAFGLAALLVVAGTAMGFRRAAGSHEAMCLGGEQRLAEIWEPAGVASARKDVIHRAFVATGKSYAEQAFAGASRYLDQYVGGWLGMYRDACEATHARGEQSAEVLDLRMACLRERLVDVRALTDELASANDKVVENAVSATSSLPRIERCADVSLLRAVVKPPVDEAARRTVEELRVQKGRLLALRYTGKCDEGRKLQGQLLPAARRVGYLPLLAEALTAANVFEDVCDGTIDEEAALSREAYDAAIASGHDQIAAEAAVYLAEGLTDRKRDLEGGREWLAIAKAMLLRIGGDPEIQAAVDQAEGTISQYTGNLEASLAAFERCRLGNVKLHGPEHPYVAVALVGEGLTLQSVGRNEEALAVFSRAKEIFTKAAGSQHPTVAQAANNAGEVLNALARYPEARASFEEAVTIWTVQHTSVAVLAYGETGLGLSLLGEGHTNDAIVPLERALSARSDPTTPPELSGETRFALARALWAKPAERPRALALARQSRTDYGRVEGAGATVKTIDAWLGARAATL